ncbi:hypothetical protein [Methylocella silvestris]|uniref:hypothetical protein n=1 Tax=Methylocella silvestris TaxID=199596 RepID=UPI0011D09D3B|nr:hypothetical protein [Methylocella silvestris]
MTLTATYLGATWKSTAEQSTDSPHSPERLDRKKTEPISVPVIADGNVAGYVVAQFIYLIDPEALNRLAAAPDAFITDEAFRKLYVEKIDFAHLEKYDLPALTRFLTTQVNRRLGADIIKDILVDQFNFVSKSDISK